MRPALGPLPGRALSNVAPSQTNSRNTTFRIKANITYMTYDLPEVEVLDESRVLGEGVPQLVDVDVAGVGLVRAAPVHRDEKPRAQIANLKGQ